MHAAHVAEPWILGYAFHDAKYVSREGYLFLTVDRDRGSCSWPTKDVSFGGPYPS